MTISLTTADSQRTVSVLLGAAIHLVLDTPGNQWSPVTESPLGLLVPLPSPAPPPHGQLAIWTAAQRGTTAIKSVGTAFCAAGTACPMYAILFVVTIVIS
jgi:hypothetical protein